MEINKIILNENIIKIFLIKLNLILILYFLNIIFINKQNLNFKINNEEINLKINVCLCTLGKNENRYIREFVQHYEKYDVDKIFLYDNNDIEGERFEDVIKDYIEKGFVKVLNWRGITKGIYKIMNNCYKSNYNKYDWLIFYEIDEFIHLYKHKSIKKFLNKKKFKDCQVIYLNLVCHTDNNLLYYQNKSLFKRFPHVNKKIKLEVKSIVRGFIPKLTINHLHTCNNRLINCNGFGHKNKIVSIFSTERDFKYYYIDHFYSKSTEEFINKLKRGDLYKVSISYYLHKIYKYYLQSNFTIEKIVMIENSTGFNLSKYKKILGYQI